MGAVTRRKRFRPPTDAGDAARFHEKRINRTESSRGRLGATLSWISAEAAHLTMVDLETLTARLQTIAQQLNEDRQKRR